MSTPTLGREARDNLKATGVVCLIASVVLISFLAAHGVTTFLVALALVVCVCVSLVSFGTLWDDRQDRLEAHRALLPHEKFQPVPCVHCVNAGIYEGPSRG